MLPLVELLKRVLLAVEGVLFGVLAGVTVRLPSDVAARARLGIVPAASILAGAGSGTVGDWEVPTGKRPYHRRGDAPSFGDQAHGVCNHGGTGRPNFLPSPSNALSCQVGRNSADAGTLRYGLDPAFHC